MKKIVALALALVLMISLAACSSLFGINFEQQFGDLAGESINTGGSPWCEIASDGSWMKIDTNPDNSKYISIYATKVAEVQEKINVVNEGLGFSSALYEKMQKTRALDGTQTDENDKVKVSWTYHPDKGLEIIYEKK